MTVSITIICLLSVVATTLAVSIKRIPEGQVYTLRRRHRPQPQLLLPGTHWIVPLRDHIAHKISLTGRTLHLDQTLEDGRHAHGKIYWQVLDAEQADAVIDQADALISQHMLEALREVTAVDAIVRNVHFKNQLNRTLRPRGMLVTRVDIGVAASVPAAA